MKTTEIGLLLEKIDQEQEIYIVLLAKDEQNLQDLLLLVKKFGYNCFLRTTSFGREVVITGKNSHVIEK